MQVVVPDADVNPIALIAFDRPFERTLLKRKPITPALLHVALVVPLVPMALSGRTRAPDLPRTPLT